jgi:hypothetical protein
MFYFRWLNESSLGQSCRAMAARMRSDEGFLNSENNPTSGNEELKPNIATDNCDGEKDPRTNYIALVKQLKGTLQGSIPAGSGESSSQLCCEVHLQEGRTFRTRKISF